VLQHVSQTEFAGQTFIFYLGAFMFTVLGGGQPGLWTSYSFL